MCQIGVHIDFSVLDDKRELSLVYEFRCNFPLFSVYTCMYLSNTEISFKFFFNKTTNTF